MDVYIYIMGQDRILLRDLIEFEIEEDRHNAILRAWEDDHGDEEWIVVPRYFDDPDGYREAMRKIAERNKPGATRPTVRIQFNNGVLDGGRITWGCRA